MQLQSDKSQRSEEIKTQFRAREGYYRLMNSPDYSQRSQRAMGFSTGTTNSNSSTGNNEKTCIKISLVTINDNNDNTIAGAIRQHSLANHHSDISTTGIKSINNRRSKGLRDKKICFNVGRELFVYNYDGVRTGPDASNPIYKRSYKGSSPTCHDFNQATATSGSLSLLVGFSHGQVQLIDLNGCDDQETCKEFNVDRLIDKTRVTCVKWLPNSPSLFLVAHASGNLYLYKDDLPCGPSAPIYQIYKNSGGVLVYTCKTKSTRNPIYKWVLGKQFNDISNSINSSNNLIHNNSNNNVNVENESCSLNEFTFSPCAKYLACVSQDGFLRVYCYDTMDLVGRARSYYGGLSCVCWSPDGKYVVTGGEDDLITVWSFIERKVVARGIGHKSWVSVVAFDSFYTGYDLKDNDVDNDDDEEDEGDKEVDDQDLEGEDEEDDRNSRNMYNNRGGSNNYNPTNIATHSPSNKNNLSPTETTTPTSYRFGSVGQDTQLCLWDLNDDLLRQPIAKPRVTSFNSATSSTNFRNVINSSSSSTTTITKQNNQDNSQQLATTSDQNKQHQQSCDNKNQQQEKNDGNEISDSNTVVESSNISKDSNVSTTNAPSSSNIGGFLSSKGSGFTKTFSLVVKRDKRNQSQRNQDRNSLANNKNQSTRASEKLVDDPSKLLGSSVCPRMNEVPLLEPTVCKKISFERLTSLIFCKGGFITSCQDGYVFSWARPSRKRVSPGQSNEELRVIDVGTSSVV